MPYDIETDNDVIKMIDGQELVADHIYINDVDMNELVTKMEDMQFSLKALHNKVDQILATLNPQSEQQYPPTGQN
jgi:hypothetical protein